MTPRQTTHIKSMINDQFIKFLMTGGICFSTNILVLYIATDVLKFHYLISMLASILIVNLVGWILNRLHTFKSCDSKPLPELAKYILVNLSSMTASLFMMYILVSIANIHYLLASSIIATLMAVINFTLHKNWSFKTSAN